MENELQLASVFEYVREWIIGLLTIIIVAISGFVIFANIEVTLFVAVVFPVLYAVFLFRCFKVERRILAQIMKDDVEKIITLESHHFYNSEFSYILKVSFLRKNGEIGHAVFNKSGVRI